MHRFNFFFFCLSFLLVSFGIAPAQDWSLSYSTYLGLAGVFHTTEVPAYLAANGSGDACVSSRDSYLISSSGLLTKVATNGSVIYSVGTAVQPNPGGTGVTWVAAIDSAGNCYLAGVGTITPTPGVFQPTPKSGQFVMKFDTAGNVAYATYLAGSGTDTPTGLAVDGSGNAYLTGSTTSNDFPTASAYQSTYGGGSSDAFVAVLNPTASALVYSTYLGGSGQDSGAAISVDGSSNAYITGTTLSANFPTVAPFQSALAGTQNAFVTKLTSAGVPTYSTYLGGTGNSQGLGIASDTSGDAYLTGTAGSGFPLVNPIISQSATASGFASEFKPDGSALLYSTYIGGDNTPGVAIAVDASGQAYITGGEPANIFGEPSVTTVSPIAASADNVFVMVLSSGGSSVVFSTYLGSLDGSCQNPPCAFQTVSTSIAIDASNDIYVAGASSSSFPLLNAANGTVLPFAGYAASYPSYVLKIAPTMGPVLATPGAVVMPPTNQGTSSQAAALLIANASSSPTINISSIKPSGDFSETDNCTPSVSAASSCQLVVTFTPTATGQRTGTITITDNAVGSPQIINLSGTGLGPLVPQVTFSPTTLTFAAQPVGTTSSRQVVFLINSGLAALNITKIAISGDFAETNTCGTSVSAGQSCQISVTFTPTATGQLSGTVTVTDNAAGSPQTVSLSGTGGTSDFTVGPSTGSPSSQTISPGQSATFMLSLEPVAGFSGTVSLSCSVTPKESAGPTCTAPSSASVTGGNAASVQVTIGTTGPTGGFTSHAVALPPGMSPLLWTLALFLSGVLLTRRSRIRLAPAMACAVIGVVFLFGCGGGSSSSNPTSSGTPAGTYTATVTATSGTLSHNTVLTVVVQ
jgi:hypothetical protein